jgi:aspartate aminotransferase
MELATRLADIQPSATLAVTARAARLKAEGRDILSLSAGEPDFATPLPIQEAAIAAIKNGQTRYTAVDGTKELKSAIIEKFKKDHGLDYDFSQVIVASGAKQAIFNGLLALLDEGDEVLIPAPYWVSYPDMVRLAGGVPVIVPTAADFQLTAATVEQYLTPRSRLLILNSPSNPSGVVYGRETLAALAEVLRAHPNIAILSDDIYEKIYWAPTPFVNILQVAADLQNRTLVINGMSKAYAMTGWRIGYAAGPAAWIGAMATLQSQSTSNPNSIAQAASVVALRACEQEVQAMSKAFAARYQFFYHGLNHLPGLGVNAAQGAFYLLPNFNNWMNTLNLKDDLALAEWLIEKAGIAAVPGSAFGATGHLRFSFAYEQSTLQAALERLRAVCPC